MEQDKAQEPASPLVQETSQEAQEATVVRNELRDLPVHTHEEISFASELLVDIKGRHKKLEDRLHEITKPLNAALKSTRDLFRPAMTAYEEAEQILKAKIGAAHAAIAAANQRAMLEAQAKLAQGDVHAAAVAATAIAERPRNEGVSVREALTYRVVNALLVPREFLVIDDKKVRAYIAQHGEAAQIPGITIEKTQQVVASRGRS
ncbi:MAG: hypothetical protein ACRCSL_16890 [Microbacterium sp.]